MKLIIAFALFAVAVADEIKVASLPKAPAPFVAQPDIRQLIIPQHVIDAIKMGLPVMRDFEEVPQAADDDLRVRFVDAPLETPVEYVVSEVANEDEDLRVRFVDAPLETPVEAVEAQDDEALRVHFVDAPLDDVAAPVAEEIAAPEAVKIAEPYLPALETAEVAAPKIIAHEVVKIAEPYLPTLEVAAPEISAPDAVRFVDAPLEVAEEIHAPEAVRIAEAPQPAYEIAEVAAPEQVEAVKISVPRFPGKQFADPRLR